MDEKINNIQEEIIEEFSKLNDWFDKYEYLIDLGKSLEPLDEKLKSEENSLSGCQSKVWLKAEIRGERILYLVASDSLITKGMISLLLRVLNNQYPEDIVNADLYFIDKIGLNTNLSPSRVNGLMSIVKHIKSYAKVAPNINK
ncbi:MAG: SufE family protein [Thermoplasmatales archaeon]|nr:MAG: SufE family protein [Thermoplasmatales archaeon]